MARSSVPKCRSYRGATAARCKVSLIDWECFSLAGRNSLKLCSRGTVVNPLGLCQGLVHPTSRMKCLTNLLDFCWDSTSERHPVGYVSTQRSHLAKDVKVARGWQKVFVNPVSRWNSRSIRQHLSQWDKETLWCHVFSSLTQKALLSWSATAAMADSMLIPLTAAGLSAASSSSSRVFVVAVVLSPFPANRKNVHCTPNE